MANLLTVLRVLLIFVVIGVWGRDQGVPNGWLDLAMVPLLAAAIIMDALDGWAARKFHEESKAGALVDIAGDRIIELGLWTFFAIRRDASGEPLISLWIPLIMITRTVLTDLVRSVAFGEGKTPFGSTTLQQSGWARAITASRWSRGAYGVLKTICWCGLGLLIALPAFHLAEAVAGTVHSTVMVLVYGTTVFSLVRAIPVLWEGRRYL